MTGPVPTRWAPYLLSVLRIVAAFSFITHGTQKLFAVPVAELREPVTLVSLAGLAGVLETFGGLLLLVGLFTRPVALVLSGERRWPTSSTTRPGGSGRSSTGESWPRSSASSGCTRLRRDPVRGASTLSGAGPQPRLARGPHRKLA
jgi:hypothetical protein